MPLAIYRRHLADCPHQGKGRRWTRCTCPIWVQGSLGGEYVRQSLNLTVWGAAQERVRSWEASGQVGVVRQEVATVREAVQKHLEDAEGRNLQPESVKKIRDIIERRFLGYCSRQGFRALKQLDVDAVRGVRNELVKDYSANSARKRLEYVRAFFRFCQDSGWISANPMAMVKPPKADITPTLPFDNAQVDALLKVADGFSAKGRFKDGNRKRVRAMILLLRYSGLRISDAADSSLKVTERHYAPWVKARQEQLEQSVRLAWPA